MILDLVLDSLTWADLVEIARVRIADRSSAWSLHAPVDPGVTLLETFALQLEERLYRLDRPDPKLLRHALRLLGEDPTAPARAATTVLEIVDAPEAGTLAVGTEFQGPDHGTAIILSTVHSACFLPGATIERFEASGIDQLPRLLAGLEVPMCPFDGPAVALLVVALPAYSASTPMSLSLYIKLNSPTGNSREILGWSSDGPEGLSRRTLIDGRAAEPVDGPFEVRWLVNGAEVEPLDGTFGLRHSGLVQVPLPQRRAAGPLVVEVATDRPASVETPLLARIIVNAVIAQHRRTRQVSTSESAVQKALESSPWNALPGIEVDLSPVIGASRSDEPTNRLFDDQSATITLSERDGQDNEWHATQTLDDCEPGDRAFVVVRGRSTLRFGDGVHGRIPRPGFPLRAGIKFDIGGGDCSNVARGNRWFADAIVAVNSTGLIGGAETETPTHAEHRARVTNHRRTVLVSSGDYGEVIRNVHPELDRARVHVIAGRDLGAPGVSVTDAVTVLCIPAILRPEEDVESFIATYRVPTPKLDDGLRRGVTDRLRTARLLGTNVYLADPRYRPVDVSVVTDAHPSVDLSVRIRGALRRYLDPIVGGEDGQGWRPGQPIVPGQLLERAQRVAGSATVFRRVVVVLGAVVPGAVGEACPTISSDCDPLPLDAIELPYLRQIELTP